MNNATADMIHEKAKASYPAIYIHSPEIVRIHKEIKAAAKELKRKTFTWTLGKGVKEEDNAKATFVVDTDSVGGACDYLTKLPPQSLLILKNFHHFLEDPGVQSKILEALAEYKLNQRTLLIVSGVLKIPPELEKDFSLIVPSLPTKEMLGVVLEGIIIGTKLKDDYIPDAAMRKELTEAATGLTTAEAENAFSLALVRPKIKGESFRWDPRVVLEEKVQALKKTGLLDYIPTNIDMTQVGGMESLKDWIKKRKRAFGEDARKFGLPSPKGVLLLGPPGGGKSLGAKAISGELGLPLIRCDMGKLFGGLVGQSESNTRMAIQVAEAVSPCVLWLDEIEKGFAGSSAGSLDSGVGARVLGTFLTWMQEKSSPVFVYATSNDIASLPPELLRKGRFDELFSVLLPDEEERKEIFKIHISKRGRGAIIDNGKPNGISLQEMADATEGFSGAEIEAVVVEALHTAYYRGAKADLNGLDLADAIAETNPLSRTMKEKLEAIETWCKFRTRAANPRKALKAEAEVELGGRNIDAA